MSIYKVFAANLRTQCSRFESIEFVCRGARVNRQQFNKYLAGQVLPHARTLQRICQFLGVAETDLFLMSDAMRLESSPQVLSQAALQLSASPVEKCPLPLGFYSCYFPMQHFDTHLVASTLCLWQKDGQVHFSRRTAFRSPSNPKAIIAKARRRGIVIVQEAGIFLIGVNAGNPPHPSLIYIDGNQPSGSQINLGLALTRGSNQPMASRVVLKYRGASVEQARRCLRESGIMSATDPSIEPLIALAFAQHGQGDPVQLNIPSLEDRLLGRPKSGRTNPAPPVPAVLAV